MKQRRGIAIVLVLVVLLLVEAMGAGMLALALHTRAAADAQLRTTRAEAAAHLAARSVLARWNSASFDTMAVGAITPAAAGFGSEADASWSATLERLQSQFVLRTDALIGGPRLYAKASIIVIARMLDRRAVLAELNAAITGTGQVVLAGTSSVLDYDSTCAAPASVLPAAIITAQTPIAAPTVAIGGAIVIDSTLSWPDSMALGNASWGDVAALADRIDMGVTVPAPVVTAGVCDSAAVANWGEPTTTASPCSSYAPLVYSPGDLTMAGGRGQGILVVAGSFAMNGGAHFHGAVVARDGISIGPNAVLTGAALSRRGYILLQDASASFSHCELQRTLAATRASRRLMPQKRRFLPVF